jgi:hypothetical protein
MIVAFFMATLFLSLKFWQELQRGFTFILISELFQVLIICLLIFTGNKKGLGKLPNALIYLDLVRGFELLAG